MSYTFAPEIVRVTGALYSWLVRQPREFLDGIKSVAEAERHYNISLSGGQPASAVPTRPAPRPADRLPWQARPSQPAAPLAPEPAAEPAPPPAAAAQTPTAAQPPAPVRTRPSPKLSLPPRAKPPAGNAPAKAAAEAPAESQSFVLSLPTPTPTAEPTASEAAPAPKPARKRPSRAKAKKPSDPSNQEDSKTSLFMVAAE